MWVEKSTISHGGPCPPQLPQGAHDANVRDESAPSLCGQVLSAACLCMALCTPRSSQLRKLSNPGSYRAEGRRGAGACGLGLGASEAWDAQMLPLDALQEWATAKWGKGCLERIDNSVPTVKRLETVQRFNKEGR